MQGTRICLSISESHIGGETSLEVEACETRDRRCHEIKYLNGRILGWLCDIRASLEEPQTLLAYLSVCEGREETVAYDINTRTVKWEKSPLGRVVNNGHKLAIVSTQSPDTELAIFTVASDDFKQREEHYYFIALVAFRLASYAY